MKKLILLSIFMTSPISLLAESKTLSGYSLISENKCGDFDKVSVATGEDQCVGLVASAEDGLKRPRRIIQIENGDFLITDMYGWAPNKGMVWRYRTSEKKLEKILTGVDHAHGLAEGPDGLIYVGERSKIFRFNSENPEATKEYIIDNLPLEGSHPLTHFIFDEHGDLIVNTGAPSDQCLDDKKKPVYPCLYEDEAAIRKYTRTSDGSYDSNFKVIAQGLRNSMGLAIHPETGNLYQAENNMDFDEKDGPKEEVNLIIEGKHYGWPYCYDNALLNPKYKRTLFNRSIPKIDCTDFESPVETLPSHSAPLDMLFYQGEMFPELKGKLVLSLHGYRETGHRIVSLDLNKDNSYKELVTDWDAVAGTRPKGSPVGMTVAKDGSIWFVEDKNKTIMVLTKGSQSDSVTTTDEVSFKPTSSAVQMFKDLKLKNRCQSCHTPYFKGSEEENLKTMVKAGWITPGKHESSLIWQRVSGTEGRQMPPSNDKLSEDEINEVKNFINSL